jgi:hypothetical protein
MINAPTMPGSYWVRLMPERPDCADQLCVTDGRRFHLLFSNCNLYAREFGETFPRAVFSERIDPPPFVDGQYQIVAHTHFANPRPAEAR